MSSLITNKIYSGTSGLLIPVTKLFYPPEFRGKSRLSYYASLYNSVEINSSFYKLPMMATVEKWAAVVPDRFRFTFKLSKTISHAKDLAYNKADVDRFVQTISHIGNKKGCLLIQFPPSLKVEKMNQLEKLLKDIKKGDPKHAWNVAVEFRHASWYHNGLYHLLKQFEASIVIHDLALSSPPVDIATDNFIYLRFHGPGGKYRGSYSINFLKKYAQYIRSWREEGKSIYFYFNNTMGDALGNLNTLNRMLEI